MLRFLVILFSFLALPLLQAAPVFEVLGEFERPPQNPAGRLIAHPDGNYYGTTLAGGVYDYGTIFRMTPAGVVSVLVSFTGDTGTARGANPSYGLTLAADGSTMYGTTLNGGVNDCGTVFKVTTSGVFTSLVDFTGMTGGNKGAVPNALVLHSDGFFYGTTQAGGVNDIGTIFKMSAAGALTTMGDFTGTSGNRKGTNPTGRLTFVGTQLYGTTQWGGSNDLGTVFKVATSGGTVTTLVDFTGVNGSSKGSEPTGGLIVVGTDLFGTTEGGGAANEGTIFKVPTAGGSLSTLRQFSGSDGARPSSPLFALGDGFLYGTASEGGSEDSGSIFKIGSASPFTFSLLASFTDEEGIAPGANPIGSLVIGHNSQLFGTTTGGGSAGNGTVYQVTTAGTVSSLATFSTSAGWHPVGAPVNTSSGVVFLRSEGGAVGNGTVGRVDPAGALTVVDSLDDSIGSPAGGFVDLLGDCFSVSQRGYLYRLADGASELESLGRLASSNRSGLGELTVAGDGNFYGIASNGGSAGKGSIFRISASGVSSTVAVFSGPDGQRPRGKLALGGDGALYGATSEGGAAGTGSVFRVDLTGALSTLYSFAATGPRAPFGGLFAGPDGNFYGTTTLGGTAGFGTVFRISPAGALTVLAEFSGESGTIRGESPLELLIAADGTIYGTTKDGGLASAGVIFRISPAGVFSTLFDFTGTAGTVRGKSASARPVFGPGGKLYGVAEEGGAGGGGTVFRIGGLGPHCGTRDAVRLDATTLELSGLVQLGGESTSVWFEYGPTLAFGSVVPLQAIAPGAGAEEYFSAQVPTPAPLQTIYFRARSSNASGASVGQTMSFTSLAAISQWKLDNLGDADAPDLGDPDGDGLPTLVEYALVLPPGESGSGPAPGFVNTPQGRQLALSVSRDPARTDVTIQVLASAGLSGPWVVVASSTNGAPFTGPGYVSGETGGGGIKTVQVRDSAALPSDAQRYMRVQVVRP